MGERKKQLKQLMAVALSLVVIGGSVNVPAMTSFAEDGQNSGLKVSETELDKGSSEADEKEKKPEDNKTEGEKEEAIIEERMDLGDYIYQCGGLGVIDMPAMLSLDEKGRALSGKEAAKEGILNGLKAWETEIDVSQRSIVYLFQY